MQKGDISKDIPEKILKRFVPAKFKNSYFLSFEGIEGAGKSTHIQRLKTDLENIGYRVILAREPGGTDFGEILRSAILGAKAEIHPIAEAHLFASSRAQLLHEKILKELKIEQTVVIYDRYIDSSFAYQGSAGGLGIQEILKIHDAYPLNTMPNLTLYIRISLDTSHQRQAIRNQGKDYFESQSRSFYQKLIDGYEQAAEIFKDRVAIIDGEVEIENVYQQILTRVKKLLC